MKTRSLRPGFTLIELLLVIGIIAILASIVIVAINPTKQLGDARNAQRRADVNTVINAIYQYSIDNNALPGCLNDSAAVSATQICETGGTCTGLCDLSALEGDYLVALPEDPQDATANQTGYTAAKAADASGGRVTIAAPAAEQGETISVER